MLWKPPSRAGCRARVKEERCGASAVGGSAGRGEPGEWRRRSGPLAGGTGPEEKSHPLEVRTDPGEQGVPRRGAHCL